MKKISAVVCVALSYGIGVSTLQGQASGSQPVVETHTMRMEDVNQPRTVGDTRPIRTFYLLNAFQNPGGTGEVINTLRNVLDASDKISTSGRNSITMRGTESELQLAQKLVNELNGPRTAYRITYTVTELDGGKRVGMQHFTLTSSSGARSTLKQGSKVPIITGSYDEQGKSGAQTQFTYLDIGLNFDATIYDLPGGVSLKSKVEQSSIAPEPSGVGTDPIVRQAVLESTSVLSLGKPLVLGSLDVPGSTRHLDFEVVVEAQR